MNETTEKRTKTWYNINVIHYLLVNPEIGYIYYDGPRPVSKTVFMKEDGVRALLKSERLIETSFLHLDSDSPDKLFINVDKVFRIETLDKPDFVNVCFISGTYFTVPEETGQKIRKRLKS